MDDGNRLLVQEVVAISEVAVCEGSCCPRIDDHVEAVKGLAGPGGPDERGEDDSMGDVFADEEIGEKRKVSFWVARGCKTGWLEESNQWRASGAGTGTGATVVREEAGV